MEKPDRIIDSTVEPVQLSNSAHISRPYAPDTAYARSFKEMTFSAGVLLLGLVSLVGFVLAAVGAWHQFIGAMGALFQFVAWALGVGIPAILIYTGARMTVRDMMLHLSALQDIRIRRDANARENKLTDAQVRRSDAETDRIYAEAEKIRTVHELDGQGNLLYRDHLTGTVHLVTGNMRQYPGLTTFHYSVKNDGMLPGAEVQPKIAAPELPLPKIEQFYEQIPYNSLQTGLGAEAIGGKLVIAPIVKSVHFKLIGGSGQGKSCVAGAILDIATTTNDPDHLRIGLLDLEHNTMRLFENLPHIAEIGPRRARLIGRNPDEVAEKLKMLQWELTRRAQLGEEHCKLYEPLLLVYVEEMLALKYEVVDEKLKKEMLDAFNILGVRGRKYGIFFLACMQVDYSDKSTREAMAQFRTRAGFAIDPEVARASGFFNTELVKQNFGTARPGQYVLERPAYSGLVLAPDYDVAAKLSALSAPSRSTTKRAPIPFIDVKSAAPVAASDDSVVDTEAAPVAAQNLPLRSASGADLAMFSAQEQRIIHKFMEKGLGIGQIVSSEFTDGKGKPLQGGDAFKQRSKEVQDILRRAFSQEAS